MEEFTVGRLTARKGTKVSVYVPVEGTNIKLPVTLIYGEEEGETVLISGGVHNAEYVGIQSAIQLATTLTPDRIVGKVIIIHLNNESGLRRRKKSEPCISRRYAGYNSRQDRLYRRERIFPKSRLLY